MITAYNKDRRKKKPTSIDNYLRLFGVENVIISRLSLRSTRTEMNKKYGVEKIEDLDSPKFKERYIKWNDEKKELFVNELGGEVNFKKTSTFLNNKFYPLAQFGKISNDTTEFEKSLNSPTSRVTGCFQPLSTILMVDKALEELTKNKE